jgi:hypothetical protein
MHDWVLNVKQWKHALRNMGWYKLSTYMQTKLGHNRSYESWSLWSLRDCKIQNQKSK